MFERKSFITESLKDSSAIKLKVLEICYEDIINASEMILDAVKSGNKLMLCGNGGSAADSQHLATEFMIRLSHDINRKAIPAIALSTDSSNLTAGGNDIGFENIFARNIEGIGRKDDVLIGISTSGNSKNIIKAVQTAKSLGVKTICLLGSGGGKLKDECDLPIIVPSDNVQRIQESHITIGHILCEITERELYG